MGARLRTMSRFFCSGSFIEGALIEGPLIEGSLIEGSLIEAARLLRQHPSIPLEAFLQFFEISATILLAHRTPAH